MPLVIGGIEVRSWLDVPTRYGEWEGLAQHYDLDEPDFDTRGMRPASGAVVVEPDGRVWAVSPSNQYGGYHTTFRKGQWRLRSLFRSAPSEGPSKLGLLCL